MRIRFIAVTALGLFSAMAAEAKTYELVVSKKILSISGKPRPALTINGSVPGPTLRWREGEVVTLRVTNRLDEDTSIHWHGLILPAGMDGVPTLSFAGIKPGATFVYRFTVKQNGTYWYHSHSGLQEQSGVYGAIAIEPAKGDPFSYGREHVIVLSDWTDESPHRVLANLKRNSGYYNLNRPTLLGLLKGLQRAKGADGRNALIRERTQWGRMRMDPSDIADVSGMTYTYLMNGQRPRLNWTALYRPGERVRLRFVNASAMTYFDVKIPGLKMTVVQADGQNVRPVNVDEFRIAVAETYDVIVSPEGGKAYTIFARSMDRSGYARGTLAPRTGMAAPVPPLGAPTLLKMSEMGPAGHGGAMPAPKPMVKGVPAAGGVPNGHDAQTQKGSGNSGAKPPSQGPHVGHGPAGSSGSSARTTRPGAVTPHAAHGTGAERMPGSGTRGGHSGGATSDGTGLAATGKPRGSQPKASDRHMGHGAKTAMPGGHSAGGAQGVARMRLHAPGSASQLTANAGSAFGGSYRKLTYGDLRGLTANADRRAPGRTIVLRLTGNMERYFWTINDVKYSDAQPIRLKYGERVRIRFVNETMMVHPMHLHGMWSELRNGRGRFNPRKHTVSVGPGQIIEIDMTADAVGEWAFHCHLLLHMETGMFRKVIVADGVATN